VACELVEPAGGFAGSLDAAYPRRVPNPEQLVPPLLTWFAAHARDLPWRRTRDPYAIWISEVMLQQTQVATVIPYWERWMRALPDVAALARAPLDRVLKLWEGLGYYKRARNLHRAAQVIVARHAGRLPRNFDAILALPGIGRYTAGAICSLAFNQPTPVLDGNVTRVLARVFGIRADVTRPSTRRRLWSLAGDLVNAAAGWSPPTCGTSGKGRGARRVAVCPCGALNEAQMELGATVCAPRNPRCEVCPLTALCVARAAGLAASLPRKGRVNTSRTREVLAFVCERRGRLLARRRPDNGVNAGLWELPNLEANSGTRALEAARALLGGQALRVRPALALRHTITSTQIRLQVFQVDLADGRLRAPANCRWIPRARLEELAFTAAHRRIVNQLREARFLSQPEQTDRSGV
jgi:A/G-specific adenine glycosylase